MPRTSAKEILTDQRLKVCEIALTVRLTPRQLARLAKKGVPGVERAANGYHFTWYARPETLKWISDRKKFRKGKRKAMRRKTGLSRVQFLVRAMRQAETNLLPYVNAVLASEVSPAQLAAVESAGRRLESFAGIIIARAQNRAHGWP